jgi:hypothetical protein
MTVAELITKLQKLPPDLEVYTNECEATSAHECLTDAVEAGLIQVEGDPKAFIGSYGYTVELRN